jgi:hypothetical protein
LHDPTGGHEALTKNQLSGRVFEHWGYAHDQILEIYPGKMASTAAITEIVLQGAH